jgi:hypothetical protein
MLLGIFSDTHLGFGTDERNEESYTRFDESTRLKIMPEDWDVVIDGIEPCDRYIGPLQKIIYNTIYNDPVEKILSRCCGYGLVLANDIIEHINKKEAWFVLNTLIKQNKWVIITLPLGDQLKENEAIHEEYPYERHRSIWTMQDFKNHPYLDEQKQFETKHPDGCVSLVFRNLKGTS